MEQDYSSRLEGITEKMGAIWGNTCCFYEMPVASAQVKSALLFAGLYAKGSTTIIEPSFTRNHAEKLFELFNIPLDIDHYKISLDGFGALGPKIKVKILISLVISSAALDCCCGWEDWIKG